MAKFRTNYEKSNSSAAMLIKVGIFGLLMGAAIWLFNVFSKGYFSPHSEEQTIIATQTDTISALQEIGEVGDYFLPASTTGQIIKHSYYALSYSEEHESAEWVAYELSRERLAIPYVERMDDFRPDPKVRKASSSPRDYSGTGYDRGHLVPAADMAFDERAMSETFYMSNISPQIRNFNSGIWRELEHNVRDWARQFNHLYVISGPVLSRNIRERIGGNQVSVPDEFYKVIVDFTEPEIKGIGFLIPNELSNAPLAEYAVTIDKIEEITEINFFPEMFGVEEEAAIEGTFDSSLWPMSTKRYEQRKTEWNKER